MADPNAAQKRMFAKMGLSMPDGSYYIRNGPVGAQDLSNAIKAVGRGEGPDKSGAEIRQHIMKRAAALKLSKEIPDTWSSDGTLKQSAVDAGQAFIEHFGVKGMHWGVRNSSSSGGAEKRSALIEKAKAHEAISAAHYAGAAHAQKEAEDLATRGVHSDVFKRVYGKDAATVGPNQFYFRTGGSKGMAVAQTEENLRLLHNQYAHSANRHAKKAAKLRDKAAKIQIQPALGHFGVKGMHWGVRNSDSPGSADHQRAQEVHGLIKTGGVKAASNQDLQDLVTRLNLEQQHARLTATPSRIDAGHTFIKKTLGITKTGIDVVNTVSPAVGAGKKVAGGVSTGIQVAKIINKTRQGQNHMS